MHDFIESIKNNIVLDCFSVNDLTVIANQSLFVRAGLIKRALARGDIIRIRRGLYCLGEKYRNGKPNLFCIAQNIYSPSYISFESALSYHGWIPEAVRTTTSASAKRSRTFESPIGTFSFQKTPERNFFIQVDRVENDRRVFFMAQPLKAVTDYVFSYRKDWKDIRPLINNMRIQEEFLVSITLKLMSELEEYYHHNRLTRFLKGLRKDLHL